MARCIGIVLSALLLVPQNAWAQDSWTSKPLKQIAVFKKLGAQSYIQILQKDLGETLLASDKAYLTKVLSGAFRQDPPMLPDLAEKESGLEVSFADVTAFIELTAGDEENLWTINGKKLEVKNKNIEELSRSVWSSLSAEYQLGPHPSLESSKTSFLMNMFLPRAEASVGTVLGVLVAVAAIAGIVYYVNKTTKATKRAIDRAGTSFERGVDRVSGSAANAIDKVGDSASTLLNKTSGAVDAGTEVINSHKKD